jgi:hypothetical protein
VNSSIFHHFATTFPQQPLTSDAPAGSLPTQGAVATEFFPLVTGSLVQPVHMALHSQQPSGDKWDSLDF